MKRQRGKRGGFFLLNPFSHHLVRPFVRNSLKQRMSLLRRERKGMGRRHRHDGWTNTATRR